jgi:hypothetical protein
MMKPVLWLGAVSLGLLVYVVSRSADLQGAIGSAATAVVRPIVLPLVELINVPAFVYCAALLILAAGVTACVLYQFAALRPHLAELRTVRAAVSDLQPPLMGAVKSEAWTDARHALGTLLQRHGLFVAAWSAFQAESLRGRGVPSRPFSSFVASEPGDATEPGTTMRALPSYFTSVGLILTFVGLVVALYFAAKGFRTGDMDQAKAAIVQLLNAASFKFLTSVSALISAFLISLYSRYGSAVVRRERRNTIERIEIYLTAWREKVGVGYGGETLAPADLLRRFDALLTGVADLARDVKRLAERDASMRPPLARDA